MTPNKHTLITVASWEARFLLATVRIINEGAVSEILLYFYREYSPSTAANREVIHKLCKSIGIKIAEVELYFEDPVATWKAIYKTVYQADGFDYPVLMDITTMPRECIWILLDFLREKVPCVTYVYSRPQEYDSEWLSRDPGKPRLVFKLGGEIRIGLPTTLLVLSGFDIDRVLQMKNTFEPEKTLIGLQTGDQFGNDVFNILRHREIFLKNETGAEKDEVELFFLDALSPDHGLEVIQKELWPHLEKSNIIMTSLGPKLSSIALFRAHMEHPELALAYAPSRQYNLYYSKGMKDTISGTLCFGAPNG